MENLHDDLRLEIFSRLPPEPLLKCKLVCKTWKNLLSHQKVGLLFVVRSYWERNLKLYYGDYNEIFSRSSSDKEFSYKSLTEINHPVINWRECHSFVDHIVGSCNGLVCFRVPHHKVNDPVYICNPVTGEYINLPRLKFERGHVVSGFGYDPPTDKYKVVRIHYRDRNYTMDPFTRAFVDVYTLGSGSGWRSLGEVTYHLSKRGVLANGSLYWLDYRQKKIVAFDLADEEFRWLPTVPQCFDGGQKVSYQIKVVGGNLCLVHIEKGQRIDIWAYKKMQKNGNDDKEMGHQSWGWTLEFTIPSSSILDKLDLHEPFALTKNNEVLLWLNNKCLYCYDQKTETLKEIVDEDDNLRTFQGIPHMNSLISLKALGEKFKSRTRQNKEKKK